MHDDLRRAGCDGSHDSVRRFAKRWREPRQSGLAHAFAPLSFEPGEACRFDWSHATVVMKNAATQVKIAHFRPSYSRMPFLIAYPREK